MEVGKSEWIVGVLWTYCGGRVVFATIPSMVGRHGPWSVLFCALYLYLNVGHKEILI